MLFNLQQGQFGRVKAVQSPTIAAIRFSGVNKSAGFTLSNDNFTVEATGSTFNNVLTTLAVTTGKYYWEILVDEVTDRSDLYLGVCSIPTPLDYVVGMGANFAPYGAARGNGPKSGATSYQGSSFFVDTPGQVVGFAVDLDNDLMWMSVNGSYNMSADPSTGSIPGWLGCGFGSTPVYPFVGTDNIAGTIRMTGRFSAAQYSYPIPAGYTDFTGVV
jgi:hypothetical protein